MSALSEIVDGAFYNLKNALTLSTKKKKTGVVLSVFHVSLCDQGYLLWFKIEFPISDYRRAHLPHLHKFCTALFFESRKAHNAGTQEKILKTVIHELNGSLNYLPKEGI